MKNERKYKVEISINRTNKDVVEIFEVAAKSAIAAARIVHRINGRKGRLYKTGEAWIGLGSATGKYTDGTVTYSAFRPINSAA